jgi:DNA replication protein DnaC
MANPSQEASSVGFVSKSAWAPLDKRGAELLFQVISKRYEAASTIITTNIAYAEWPRIFTGDATLASALLDQLLHHAETVVIEGESYRGPRRK